VELAILLFIVLAWQAGDGNVADGVSTLVDDVVNGITRGARVTNAPYDKSTGVVNADPQGLADQGGVDLDTMALARMLSSEEGSSDNTTKAACCWAAVNYCNSIGSSPSRVLLHAVDPNHSGRFGTFTNIDKSSPYYTEDRNGRPNRADRYASTGLDAYQGDVDIATSVRAGQIQDFTGGATQFDRPEGEKDPAAIGVKRITAGAEEVNVPGADPGLRFWRPA
jgi:hypothetical protein